MLTSISAIAAACLAAIVMVRWALAGARRRRRADRRLLLGLNDHLLADLGLTRADIQGVVWGVVPVAAVGEGPEASAEVVPLRPKAGQAPPELPAAA